MRILFALLVLAPAISIGFVDDDRLMVYRQGSSPKSFMITHGILGFVSPNTSYVLERSFLVARGKPVCAQPKTLFATRSVPRVIVKGQWNRSKQIPSGDANILGGFQTYETDTDHLVIPVVQATKDSLAYYGARLVLRGDAVVFESEVELPITHVEVGPEYFSDYLMKEERGGGFYVEYHDRPHFHFALDSNASGYLVLGKLDEAGSLALTGFRIPEGAGVYTPPNVIHSDATLTGHWLVVYSIADEFSTALLRSRSGNLVAVSSRDMSTASVWADENHRN